MNERAREESKADLMQWLSRALQLALRAVVITILLQFLGGFSTTQGVTLSVFMIIYYAYAAMEKTRDEMTPFSVTIHPNWHLLLKDNGLIDDEKAKEMGDDIEDGMFAVMDCFIIIFIGQFSAIVCLIIEVLYNKKW